LQDKMIEAQIAPMRDDDRRSRAAGRAPAVRLDPTLQFMQCLWAVDHGLQSMSKRMWRQVGLTGPQRLVVRVLGTRPGLSAGELAAVLHIHPSTLTGVVQRLERLRLVRRTVARDDRRRVVLQLTAAGRKLDQPAPGTVEWAVRRVLRSAPRARVTAAMRLLTEVAAELQATVAAPRSRHGR
jgi:DNA-binding MarR family transcriptional regulator